MNDFEVILDPSTKSTAGPERSYFGEPLGYSLDHHAWPSLTESLGQLLQVPPVTANDAGKLWSLYCSELYPSLGLAA